MESQTIEENSKMRELTESSQPEQDVVKTLFISGLPPDVKQRELYLLCRNFEGYESSVIKVMTGKNGKCLMAGFVTFNTHLEAKYAKEKLQGIQFDPGLPQTLRLEFARSNTKTSQSRQQATSSDGMVLAKCFPAPTGNQSSNIITGNEMVCSLVGAQSVNSSHYTQPSSNLSLFSNPVVWPSCDLQLHTSAFTQNIFNPVELPLASIVPCCTQCRNTSIHHQQLSVNPLVNQAQQFLSHLSERVVTSEAIGSNLSTFTACPTLNVSTLQPMHGISLAPFTPASLQDNTRCSTLFVANLGASVTEQELKEVFSSCVGFRRLQLHTKGRYPVAFVEFQMSDDSVRHHPYKKEKTYNTEKGIQCATEAMRKLQGKLISSSDRGGIRIEYAKAKMSKKKDIYEDYKVRH